MIRHYNIRDKVEGNFFNCYVELNESIGASAFEYPTFHEVEFFYTTIADIRSPHLARTYGYSKRRTGGLLFVEKVVPFPTWVNSKRKLNMWKCYGADRRCIGVGEHFKTIFKYVLCIFV